MRPNLRQSSFCAALLACLLVGSGLAAGKSYQLTVSAGKHDRANTPVTVLIDAPAEAKSVTLTDADGKQLLAQVTAPGLLNASAEGKRELHFILRSLKKGESLKLKAAVSADAPAAEGFAWKDTPGEHAELSYGKRPVLRYVYKAPDDSNQAARELTYKVFHHLYNPAGTRFVTKGAGGKYSHHRGLFFGYCHCTYDGGKADTWGCGGSAHQVHKGFLADEAGAVVGRHLVAIDWCGQPKSAFVKEKRELTVYRIPGGSLVEFASRLTTAGGKVKLDGNAPHAGFQFRAAQEVADETEKMTYYLRTDGKGELGQARASAMNLPWDAISFVLGENRYSVVYLDTPANPKPAEYNERTYGRFGSFFRYELDGGKDLVLNYRIWLQDGEMTVDQAAALSADFVEPVEVTVE